MILSVVPIDGIACRGIVLYAAACGSDAMAATDTAAAIIFLAFMREYLPLLSPAPP